MAPYSLADDFDGRVALVTGGARGIGRGVAETLAGFGCTVVINDVDDEALAETIDDLDASGATVAGLEADVSDPEEVAALFEEVERRFGGLDVLVNNAAVIDPGAYDEIEPEGWRRVLSVDLDGVHYCCSAGAPLLADSGGGAIVNLSSIAGQRISLLAGAHYTAAKWGVIGLTKHVAYEYGDRGVRANAICPGPTETPGTEALTDPGRRAAVADEVPLGRWGRPEDLGRAVAFLASDMASFVTGTTLTVDGGFTIR